MVQSGKEKDELPTEGCTTDQKIVPQVTDPISSSFSTHTQTDATKFTPNRNINAGTSRTASATSRRTRHSTRPPTSPPKEPVPALPTTPTTPTTTPIHYIYTKRNGDDALACSFPDSLPVQSRRKQGHPHTQPSPVEGSPSAQVARYQRNAQNASAQGHLYRRSGSSSSSTSHKSRSHRQVQPPSKQQLTLPVATIESPVRSKPPASHNQHVDRYSRSDPNKQSDGLAGTSTHMQPIREPPTGSSDALPLRSSRAAISPAIEGTRSAEDFPLQTQSKVRDLRGSKSSLELDQLEASRDIRLAASRQVVEDAGSLNTE
jgi:hypothetical protein